MKVKIRADSVEIEGYVNAIERASKPLWSRLGRFIERICSGAFKKALKRAEDVHILLNHDWNRDLGSIRQGNLELEEDNIGLHARATITDPEVIEDARRGDLVGWSFGFKDRDVENDMEDGLPLRKVRDLDLFEVSLLNRKMTPAYNGTLVTTRAVDGEEEIQFRGEPLIADEVETEVEKVVENLDDDTGKNERATEENTEGTESQEQKEPSVEKPVEKNANINYNKVKTLLNEIKEEL
jgi:HK97 family phage prohead protease